MRWIAVCLLASLASCRPHRSGPVLDSLSDGTPSFSHAALHPVLLHGTQLVSSPVIGDPRHLVVVGNTLWLADHSGDPYLHQIDLSTGSIIASRGRHGEGPGDFGEIPQLTLRPGDGGAIWAFDARLRRLTRVTGNAADGYRVLKGINEQVEQVWSYQWLAHDRLVGIGDMDTNRIMLSDTAGYMLAMVPSRLLGPDSVPIGARRALSSFYSICTMSDVGRIAVLYGGGGRIDIHDASGMLSAQAKVPFPSDGEWVPGKRGVWFKSTWIYYVDCAASPRYLYALFAGHRTDAPGKATMRAARFVHVFNWHGDLVRVLQLDKEMSAIAVSGDTLLYAAGQLTEGVVQYRITGLPVGQ